MPKPTLMANGHRTSPRRVTSHGASHMNRLVLMARIFVSHAHADAALASHFVSHVVQLGSGVPDSDIFYSSGAGTGVRTGFNLNEHVRRNVDEAGLVIALITPAFEASPFCIAELGAAWSRTGALFPLANPDMSWQSLSGVLDGLAVRSMDDEAALDDLHDRLHEVTGSPSTARTWGEHKRNWLRQLPMLGAPSVDLCLKRPFQLGSLGIHRSDDQHHSEVFRISIDGSLEHCWIPADDDERELWDWSDWIAFEDDRAVLDVALIQDRTDHALMFVLAQDGRVLLREWTLEHRWVPSKDFGRPFRGGAVAITASSREAHQFDVFVSGHDGTVRMKWFWSDRWFHEGDHDGWYTLGPRER